MLVSWMICNLVFVFVVIVLVRFGMLSMKRNVLLLLFCVVNDVVICSEWVIFSNGVL